MAPTRISWLLAVPILALACGSSGGSGSDGGPGLFGLDGGITIGADSGSRTEAGAMTGPDGGGSKSDGGTTKHDSGGGPGDSGGTTGDGGALSNVAPMIVDDGPPGTSSVDVPFVSVTICIPGTMTCQTIDHVSVDTGSSGLRIVASVLQAGIVLPQQMATTGSPLVECSQFADGYSWGSVRMADVKVAGEHASNIPIQLIGDPAFGNVPSDCSSSGPSEDTVADFGGNGLIGINQIVADCGPYCADTTQVATGEYYSCPAGGCTAVAVAVNLQISNPIAAFAADNNGAVLQFPTVAAAGAATLAGQLVFGIGTAANNALGSASVLTLDENGNFSTVFNGQTFATSFIDSGSNSYSFNDNAIAQCPNGSEASGFFCPGSTVSLSAQNKGQNGVMTTVSLSIANADTLFGNASYSVFDNLGGPGIDNSSFDWGFPFFIGRNVYVALDGASTPGGAGPYVAY